ncbi:oligosaccharide flippase family protein [Candidatus Roizmanbacteria bacterium]|nr:oligosaccharide flippase family protein [Candidatus Roizmanbacteria bacterium]
MKVALVVTLFHTPKSEVSRLKGEIKGLGFPDYRIYWIDNTQNGRGYAGGVNEGIRKGEKDKADIFIICNPDISLKGLTSKDLLDGRKYFNIWGLAMTQDQKTYYGGEIDPWRLSGGLVDSKPTTRFTKTDFVTGSLIMFDKETLSKTGYWDESYFMYYEDVDFCERARRKGLTVGIDSKRTFIHFETSKDNTQKNYLLAKNRLRFLLTYGNLMQKVREFIRTPRTLFEERNLIVSEFVRSSFVRNFFSLNASAFINKALHFLLFITMIRYIPLKEYGIYTLAWAHVTIFSPLVDFGTTSYGMVYLPREGKDKVHSLFTLRFFLSLVIFIITLFLAYLFHYQTTIIFYIFLVSFVIFYNMTSGMYLILTSVREEMVKASVISVVTNAVMIGCMILTTYIFRSIGTIMGVASFFYILYSFLYLYLIQNLTQKLKMIVEIKEWISIVKKSYVFVLVSLFAGIYFKIDVFILNFLKGTSDVGIYSSGYKFFEAMILFASSYNMLSASIFSKIALDNKIRLFPKVMKHILFLSLVGFGVVAATQLLGNIFLPHVLKGNYGEAIGVVKIVIWALPLILYNSIFLNLLYVFELSHLAVGLFIFISLVNATLNFIFVPHYSYIASSYITVISETVNMCILLILVFGIYKKKIFS